MERRRQGVSRRKSGQVPSPVCLPGHLTWHPFQLQLLPEDFGHKAVAGWRPSVPAWPVCACVETCMRPCVRSSPREPRRKRWTAARAAPVSTAPSATARRLSYPREQLSRTKSLPCRPHARTWLRANCRNGARYGMKARGCACCVGRGPDQNPDDKRFRLSIWSRRQIRLLHRCKSDSESISILKSPAQSPRVQLNSDPC